MLGAEFASVDLTDPARLMPEQILSLQQTIGNQAVQRMLVQRQEAPSEEASAEPGIAGADVAIEDTPPEPLTPQRVQLAISFYQQRKSQYTRVIIRQMQTRLNELGVPLEVDGIIGPATVQAVARFQMIFLSMPNTFLAPTDDRIDGMAGPRTLPALFPSGLASEESIEDYAADAHEIEDEWGDLGGSQARIDKLVAIVQTQLDNAGVPHPTIRVVRPEDDPNDQMDDGTVGLFDWETWEMTINPVPFEAEEVTEAEFADMADTIYHESRHAEQFYRIAQMLAGQDKSAQEIFDETRIRSDICDKAVGEPLAPGSMEALIADGWYQSVFGTGSEHREAVLNDPNAPQRDYQYLPEESDAWRVGDQFQKTYTGN
jgi:hypothetical protein